MTRRPDLAPSDARPRPARPAAAPRWMTSGRALRLSAIAIVATACGPTQSPATGDSARASAFAIPAKDSLPQPVAVATVAFRIPEESEIRDSVVLASIRRGRAILTHTGDSLPHNVGNALVCTNCHQKEGTLRDAMPWVGVYARFPQYRSRGGTTIIIEDRVNDCFKRSMNGKPLDPESREMRDIVAYFAFLSNGVPVGAEVKGQGLPKLDPLPGDTARGAKIFTMRCARCHGVGGDGTPLAPPVWGDRSYNIGAGMARVRTAAAFIKHWMPQDSAGVLTAQEAFDVASFVDSRPRPDFKGKEKDWPNGDAPPDVAYPTEAAKRTEAAKPKEAAKR